MSSSFPSGEFPYMYDYSDSHVTQVELPASYVDEVLQPLAKLPLPEAPIILDLAAGLGDAASTLKKIFPQAKVLVSDLNPQGLQHIITDNSEMSIFASSLQHLPVGDNRVDLIHCKEGIVHLPDADKKSFFLGVLRVLKPGGFCVVTFSEVKSNVYQQQTGSQTPVERIFKKTRDYLSATKLAKELNASGYHIQIGPPFFQTSVSEARKQLPIGLEILKEMVWQPKEAEIPRDWYQQVDKQNNLVAVPRIVWIMQKIDSKKNEGSI